MIREAHERIGPGSGVRRLLAGAMMSRRAEFGDPQT